MQDGEKQLSIEASQHVLLPLLDGKGDSSRGITHLDVLIGPQTFTSEQLAASLADKAKQSGIAVTVQSLDDFKPEQYFDVDASYCVAVFVVSTHAAGKPSPNAERFLLWLRKASNPFCSSATGPPQLEISIVKASAPTEKLSASCKQSPRRSQASLKQSNEETHDRPQPLAQTLRPSCRFKIWNCPFKEATTSRTVGVVNEKLRGFHYAVFGVGNSIYRTFNAPAKYVDERLQELGAGRVCPLALGDISKNIDTTFEQWATQLLQIISRPLNGSAVHLPAPADLPPHRMSLPCVTPPQSLGHSEGKEGEFAKMGPTLADIELPDVATHPRHGKGRQRRYSSAMTMILARRGSFETSSAAYSVSPLPMEPSKT